MRRPHRKVDGQQVVAHLVEHVVHGEHRHVADDVDGRGLLVRGDAVAAMFGDVAVLAGFCGRGWHAI